jgi:Ca2+-binding EF-hand superfamily protein
MSSHSAEEIKIFFDKYDTDHSGFIDTSDLRKICELFFVNIGSPEVESVIVNADAKRDGKVSFDEVCKLFTA